MQDYSAFASVLLENAGMALARFFNVKVQEVYSTFTKFEIIKLGKEVTNV